MPSTMLKAVFWAACAAVALRRASGTDAIDAYRYRLWATPGIRLETVTVRVTVFDAGLTIASSNMFGVSLFALDVRRTGRVTRSVSKTPVIAMP